MKPGKHQKSKQRYQDLCWKINGRSQSFVLLYTLCMSKYVTNAFLLVSSSIRSKQLLLIGSLSTRVFETRTATGSELFSILTCPHTTTFTLLSIFSPLEMSNIQIWGTSTRNVPFRLQSASQKHACLRRLERVFKCTRARNLHTP